MHDTPHTLSGQRVTLKGCCDEHKEKTVRLEDWWDRVAGKSWMDCDGNPACLAYAIRAALAALPSDDNVLYGEGQLYHESEIIHKES